MPSGKIDLLFGHPSRFIQQLDAEHEKGWSGLSRAFVSGLPVRGDWTVAVGKIKERLALDPYFDSAASFNRIRGLLTDLTASRP